MVELGPRNPTVTTASLSWFVAVLVLASSCMLGVQCCMPSSSMMMPMAASMMMPMMEQTQNAMVFQASSSMFESLFDGLGGPLMQLHFGGATALVSTVLMQMSPFPFAPANWFETGVQVGNFIASTLYAVIGLVEAIFTTTISLAQINWWDLMAGKVSLLYQLRLLFSPLVETDPSPLAFGADQEVALLLRDLNDETGERAAVEAETGEGERAAGEVDREEEKRTSGGVRAGGGVRPTEEERPGGGARPGGGVRAGVGVRAGGGIRATTGGESAGRSYQQQHTEEEAAAAAAAAAQDCVREMVCAVFATRATNNIWNPFWNVMAVDEEEDYDRDDYPSSLPPQCKEQDAQLPSCYTLVDSVVTRWQSRLEYYRSHYYSSSGSNEDETIPPWSWGVFG